MAKPRGTNIKAKRIAAGIRRPALADRVGISYAHLANIENGHTTAAPETLVLIARELRLRVDEVMEASEDSRPVPTHPKPPPHPGPRSERGAA